MNEQRTKPVLGASWLISLGMQSIKLAAPLYYQKLEQSLNLNPLLDDIEKLCQIPIVASSEESENELKANCSSSCNQNKVGKKTVVSKQDKRVDRLRIFNFSRLDPEREWLKELLLDGDSSEHSSDESVTEEEIRREMKMHLLRKRYRRRFYKTGEGRQYRYYSTGFLSTVDLYDNPYSCNVDDEPEEEVLIPTKKRKYNKTGKYKKTQSEQPQDQDNSENIEKIEPLIIDIKPDVRPPRALTQAQIRSKLKKEALQVEVLTARRRKVWALMMKKEICKVQRHRTNRCKEMQINLKRIAQHCLKYSRQKAMQLEKYSKDIPVRARRLTREMQTYWKRCDRVERETRRRMEKEAEEQRKMDVEYMEVKRQQRKLNFLITQTELYAHFMSKKLGESTFEDQIKILSQLDEDNNLRVIQNDDYDSESLKRQVQENVEVAFQAEEMRSKQFGETKTIKHPDLNEERPQPKMFTGNLKHYQLRGMNWIANLYDQGINGILADEMGLGKTVQSIAFLCHIAEKYSVWGPFLIISPSSTLHNWQQEFARFVPDFKVVPYWGSPNERKILRQFWNSKGLHTRDASFHVVITSYQLVITDIKYFNRIKWQYLILDEAQAIKSASSVRWKMLLGFSCRNRLLLSGTPIQNSMAELWALLHFIMPSMFDSHNEFNEWFSKDIESHAENKTSIDEKHLTRLHLILKPFMLRRIKKDVENELSDKIEIMMYCPLTSRQKMLYAALRKKIRIEDLLHSTGSYQSQAITSNLMNLVMQFRKVCNHPELFERREAKSPFSMKSVDFVIPILLFENALLYRSIPSKQHLFYNKLNIFNPEYVNRSLKSGSNGVVSSCFSFLTLTNLSVHELNSIALGDILYRWLHIIYQFKRRVLMLHRLRWWNWSKSDSIIIPVPETLCERPLQFTSYVSDECVFSFGQEVYHSMPETIEHRRHRSRKISLINSVDVKPINVDLPRSDDLSEVIMIPEFSHVFREPIVYQNQSLFLPKFIHSFWPKVTVRSKRLYSWSRRAAWWLADHECCTNQMGSDCIWFGSTEAADDYKHKGMYFHTVNVGGIERVAPNCGWSNILIPDKQTLLSDASKLSVLDGLLRKLKEEGHRVLIFSQMTKMIDLLEEYMCFRKHKYMRLDGSSKISDRRDMVADFQTRSEIFVFLLSTRAGGLGINLTAADTVIFYDSDWNPTVDQQAMDRTHRLGQTKQVTVYRLICKDTIEERMLQRAREKCEIQRMVISGGGSKMSDVLKPKEVVSLLLDDEDIEQKYRQKQLERRQTSEAKHLDNKETDRKRKHKNSIAKEKEINLNDSEDLSNCVSETSEQNSDLNDLESTTMESDFLHIPNESPVANSRGRISSSKRGCRTGAKRGRPFYKNVAPSGVPCVNPLSDKAVLSRRAPGRPRVSRGGRVSTTSRQRPPPVIDKSPSPSCSSQSSSTPTRTTPVLSINPYTDLQIVPSDVSS